MTGASGVTEVGEVTEEKELGYRSQRCDEDRR